MTSPRPPHLVPPISTGGSPLRTGDEEDYIPEKLWGVGEWTQENKESRFFWRANNPIKAARAFWSRTSSAIVGELPHAIRFRDMWVTVHTTSGRAIEHAHEAALKAVIAFELQQDVSNANRAWRRIPIVIVNDAGRHIGTYDLETAADCRTFLDAWAERELREHAVIHDAASIASGAIDNAYRLTTDANAARTAGNTTLEDEKVEAWQASIAALNAITEADVLKWLYDDPNLLVSVVPTASQTLNTDGDVTIHASRKRWFVPVVAVGAGRIRFRNIVKDRVELPKEKWRQGMTTDTATGKSIVLNLDEDVPVGTYTLFIDLMEANNPDPVAATSVEIAVPATEVTANAGRGVSVPKNQAIQFGGLDTVKYPVGETTITWTRVSGVGGTLIDETTAMPTFSAPDVTEPTEIIWRKTVTNNGVSDFDDGAVVVCPRGGQGRLPDGDDIALLICCHVGGGKMLRLPGGYTAD